LDDYIYYATTVLVISAGSIAISLVETRRQAKMLRKMATSEEKGIVRVKNPGGGVDEVISRDLVPGDVILIPSQGCILPCDVILTRGAVLVNEAMLTGESTPVQVHLKKKILKIKKLTFYFSRKVLWWGMIMFGMWKNIVVRPFLEEQKFYKLGSTRVNQ
jgi:P-type E1-E2 ATPase